VIRLAFRLDDPSPTSHRGLEEDLLAVLEHHGLPCSFAVVPFRTRPEGEIVLDKNRAAHIIEAHAKGLLEVALHGYRHERARIEGVPTEFMGVPYADQVQMITRGKTCLETLLGNPIAGFVPPWNSYDANTRLALQECGLRYISAAKVPPSFHRGAPVYVPLTSHVQEVKAAVEDARRFAAARPAVIVVMHHYDFEEAKQKEAVISLKAFADLAAWLAQQADIKISTLAEVADNLDERQADRQLGQAWWRAHIPYRFRRLMPSLCFTSRPLWRAFVGY